MRFIAAALSLACAWIAASPSRLAAQERASTTRGRVRLEVLGCPVVSTAVVRRVLGIEIGDLLRDGAEGDAGEVERLTIRCAGNVASVEVRDPAADPPTERLLPLDDFPGDAAPRALALLGVELLAARSAAVREQILLRHSGTAAPVEAMAAAAPANPPPAPPRRELRAGVAGVWRTFIQRDGASAFGGRLEASSTAARFGVMNGDVELASGSRDVASVGQTTALLLSAGATCGLFAARQRWRAAAGLGARVGLARESGRGVAPTYASGTTFVRPWGGPILDASLSARLGRLALTVAAEAGWSLSSIDEIAAGATAIAIRGPWAALSVGADLARGFPAP